MPAPVQLDALQVVASAGFPDHPQEMVPHFGAGVIVRGPGEGNGSQGTVTKAVDGPLSAVSPVFQQGVVRVVRGLPLHPGQKRFLKSLGADAGLEQMRVFQLERGPILDSRIDGAVHIVHADGEEELHAVVVSEFHRGLDRIGTQRPDVLSWHLPVGNGGEAAMGQAIDVGPLQMVHAQGQILIDGIEPLGPVRPMAQLLCHARQVVAVVVPDDPFFRVSCSDGSVPGAQPDPARAGKSVVAVAAAAVFFRNRLRSCMVPPGLEGRLSCRPVRFAPVPVALLPYWHLGSSAARKPPLPIGGKKARS